MSNNRRAGGWVPLLRSYPDSEKINTVSMAAELLYVRLLTFCDDAGNFYADPHEVLGKCLTKRWRQRQIGTKKVATLLAELEEVGLIVFYGTDVSLLHIMNYPPPLRKDRTWVVTFPLPACDDPVTNAARVRDESVTLQGQGEVEGRGRGEEEVADSTAPPTNFAVLSKAWQEYTARTIIGKPADHQQIVEDLEKFGLPAILAALDKCKARGTVLTGYQYLHTMVEGESKEQAKPEETTDWAKVDAAQKKWGG